MQRNSHRWLAATTLVLLAASLGACGPTISATPRDRFPEDAWRRAAVPLPVGEPVIDTLDVGAGDHTDWKSIAADRRGTLVLHLSIYRNEKSGHLQVLNPHGVVVLSYDLDAGQQTYDVEVPVVHPGTWLVGLSIRGGNATYEMRAAWR